MLSRNCFIDLHNHHNQIKSLLWNKTLRLRFPMNTSAIQEWCWTGSPNKWKYALRTSRYTRRPIISHVSSGKLSGNKINCLSTVINGNVHTIKPAAVVLVAKRAVIFFSAISSPDGGRDIALRGSRGLRPFVIRAQTTSHSPFPILSLTRLCTSQNIIYVYLLKTKDREK